MYRDILQNVDGIGIFPAVSLVLFVIVFTLAVLHAFRIDAARARLLATLPLEPQDLPNQEETSR